MHSPKAQLRTELRAAGAKNDELAPLVKLAMNLEHLQALEPTPIKPVMRLKNHLFGMKYSYLFYGLTAVLCLLIGMSAVTFSQTSLPGNVLYPIKRISENTMVVVHPEYRATAMMHRAEEVKELVVTHAASARVTATLADYNSQAAAYKMPSYATLEYCKTNLQQAAHQATPAERQAINKTLSALST